MTFDMGGGRSDDSTPRSWPTRKVVHQSADGHRKYQHLRNFSLEGVDDELAQQLLAQYGRLVPHVLRKFKLPRTRHSPITEDDMVAVGRAVLLQSWIDYDSTRGAFTTWACLNLSNAFYELIREARGYAPRAAAGQPARRITLGLPVSLSQPIGDREKTTLADHLPDEHAGMNVDGELDAQRALTWLRTMLRDETVLDERDRTVLLDFANGETCEATGVKLGITRQRVDQIKAKALTKLRRYAARAGLLDR